jgi:hypothetical protein
MKKFLLVLICAIFLFNCKKSNNFDKQELKTIKVNINTILDNWHKNAAKANFKQYFEAMDSTSIFIGTDASENWQKKEFVQFSKPYFDKGKVWNFKPLERNIYIGKTGEVAWFDELLDTWMGICRGSGVLERSNNSWKIKQYILSITIPNDCTKEVIKLKYKKDSAFIKTLQ